MNRLEDAKTRAHTQHALTAIQPVIKITPPGVAGHTPEFENQKGRST